MASVGRPASVAAIVRRRVRTAFMVGKPMARNDAFPVPRTVRAKPPWQRVAGWQVLVNAAFGVLAMALGNSGDRWRALLDAAHLDSHEAGQPICGVLDACFGAYRGPLGQLTLSFRRRRQGLVASLAAICSPSSGKASRTATISSARPGGGRCRAAACSPLASGD